MMAPQAIATTRPSAPIAPLTPTASPVLLTKGLLLLLLLLVAVEPLAVVEVEVLPLESCRYEITVRPPQI